MKIENITPAYRACQKLLSCREMLKAVANSHPSQTGNLDGVQLWISGEAWRRGQQTPGLELLKITVDHETFGVTEKGIAWAIRQTIYEGIVHKIYGLREELNTLGVELETEEFPGLKDEVG